MNKQPVMNKYFENLVKQFMNAKNITHIKSYSSGFRNDLIGWLKEQQIASDKYISIFEYIEVFPLYDQTTAEIGKGFVDSIGNDLGIKIITPYSEKIYNYNDNVIPANLEIYNGFPIVVKETDNDLLFMPLHPKRFRNFITQNPYNNNLLQNWEVMHNGGNYNIVVGVYGKTSDKDRKNKIKMLKEFKDKLETGYKEEQAIIYDNYCYLIYSDNPIKRLVKNK